MLHGRTVDVSTGGVSLLLPHPVPPSGRCTVKFAVPGNGKPIALSVQASAVYCTLSGVDGFRVGFAFVDLDAASLRILAEFTK